MTNRGMVLPVVLAVLTVTATMIAAAVMLSAADLRTGAATLESVKVQGRAEQAALAAVKTWPDSVLRTMPVGSTLTWHRRTGLIGVTRTGFGTFVFNGVAWSQSATIRRRVTLPAAAKPLVFPASGALTSHGAVRAASEARILDPPGIPGSCNAADSLQVGWMRSGPRLGPPVDLSRWRRLATVRLGADRTVSPAPDVLRGRCQYADSQNWGDPGGTSRCRAYRPVVFADGSLKVSGGVGQGVLAVSGDLEISGGFRFDGLIAVEGGLKIVGSGGRIAGAVMVGDRWGSGSDLGKNARISYSTCILGAVGLWLGSIGPLRRGGWFGEY